MRDLWLCKGAAVASGVVYGAQFAVDPMSFRQGGHDVADFVERRIADQVRRASGVPASSVRVWWEYSEDVYWSSLPASSDAEEGPELVCTCPAIHYPPPPDCPAHGEDAEEGPDHG